MIGFANYFLLHIILRVCHFHIVIIVRRSERVQSSCFVPTIQIYDSTDLCFKPLWNSNISLYAFYFIRQTAHT